MVNDGMVHGPEHAIGNIRRTGNLQKMAACMNHFISEGFEAELYTLAGPASNRWRLFPAPVFSAAFWDLKASSHAARSDLDTNGLRAYRSAGWGVGQVR